MKTKSIVKPLIGFLVIGGGLGFFIFQTMQSSYSYYLSVDEFSSSDPSVKESNLRLAGRVKPESISRDLEKMSLSFILAGTETEIPVIYKNTVPDNFTENIEVVVEGKIDPDGVFNANILLTRCESKYKAKVE